MATAPDRWVSESRLRQLLGRESEAFDLDFKTVLDIQSDPRHRLRLAKLVAAMTALSGDIVVGVDAHGVPTGQVTPELAQVYDEANLRKILLRHLPQELRIHSQTHLIDGRSVVLIHVEAGGGGPLEITKDGIYENEKKQTAHEFRAGERYIREGTSNARFTGAPHQIDLLLKQRSSAPPAPDPAHAMTLAVSPAELADAARELLRQRDDIPLRTLLNDVEPVVRNGLAEQAWPEVTAALDRLVVLASVYINLGAVPEATAVIETLRLIFEIGFSESDIAREATCAFSPRLWLEVTARVEILGGLAVRRRRWELVRMLGLWLPPQVRASGHASWIRVAMTTRRHENWPRRDDERHSPKSIPEVAVDIAHTLPQAYEDVAGDDDRLRESIGYFDFAVCLMSIAELNDAVPHVLMTEGTLLAGREGLTGFLRLIFPPGPARDAVFPLDDADLAVALRAFENALHNQGHWTFGWYGETDQFIERHVRPSAE